VAALAAEGSKKKLLAKCSAEMAQQLAGLYFAEIVVESEDLAFGCSKIQQTRRSAHQNPEH